ncbi:hypothetical protein OROMI_018296 [Orobanche minor]
MLLNSSSRSRDGVGFRLSIRHFRKLSEVFELKFADRLGHAGVNMLLDFLKGNDHHRNKKIQPLHIHPLFLRKGCLASSSVATGGDFVRALQVFSDIR